MNFHVRRPLFCETLVPLDLQQLPCNCIIRYCNLCADYIHVDASSSLCRVTAGPIVSLQAAALCRSTTVSEAEGMAFKVTDVVKQSLHQAVWYTAGNLPG
jgi:hypothetical protein